MSQENEASEKQNLKSVLESKSGRNVKVEKKQAVVGNNTEYTITNQKGAETDVKINDETNSVEVRGAQKNIKDMVEKGDLTNVNTNSENNNQVQEEAITMVNSSNLSSEEKQAEISKIQSHDFSKKPEGTHQQYLEDVRTKLNEKNSKAAPENDKEPNALEQAFNEVVGAGSNKTDAQTRETVKTTMSPQAIAEYVSNKARKK